MVAGGRPGAESDRVVPGRTAALCQLGAGALQPEVGLACGDRFIANKAFSEDRRGHSPQTPRGEHTTRGETAHGETHPPTAVSVYLCPIHQAPRGPVETLKKGERDG